MSEFKIDGARFVQRTTTCSKPNCPCQNGKPHGPYWWVLRQDGSRHYVGRRLPAVVEEHLKQRKENAAAYKEKAANLGDQAHQFEKKAADLRSLQRAIISLLDGWDLRPDLLKSVGIEIDPELMKSL
jgi:hypothetical protein